MLAGMAIVLTNVSVLIPTSSPDALLVAERCVSQGAQVRMLDPSQATSDNDQGDITTDVSADATWSGIGLVVLPAGTEAGLASQLKNEAGLRGVPVNDLGGAVERQSKRNALAPGSVTLVGGGPGDRDLITVAGRKAVEDADVILADHLGPFDLAEEAAERGVELVDVSKLPYGRQVTQEKIIELMTSAAKAGKRVVRLKGGDSFIFGRGFEEGQACAAEGIPVRVIPGVTSATAAPATAGLSLTQRGVVHDVSIISGHVPPGHPKSLVNWAAVAAMGGTVELIMAVKNAGAIATELVRHGKAANTPVTIIESATVSGERTTKTTLSEVGNTIDNVQVKPPAIIVIGEVAGELLTLDR